MMSTVIYWTFAALVFIAEVFLWVGPGRLTWLYLREHQPRLGIVFGVLASVVVIVLWGFFMAPNADRRLPDVPRAIIVGAASLLIGFLLYRNGDHAYGLIMMVPVTIIAVAGQLSLIAK